MPYRTDAPRRTKGEMTPFNTNLLQAFDPYNALWWSAAFPGAGHIMLGKMVKGTLLFIWEFTINSIRSGCCICLRSTRSRFATAIIAFWPTLACSSSSSRVICGSDTGPPLSKMPV